MSYIGNTPTTAAFPFDQFSGNGTTTAFTLTYAPAGPTSIIVTIAGVVQNPNLYSVVGTTLTFSPAPPAGTNNITVLYLGLPVIGVSSPGNTAYFSATDITATAGQVTFTPSGAYTPGFVKVFRNGARLGNADFTATNGVTVTLANPCVAGDIVTIETYILTSISNALPLTGGTVTGATTFNSTLSVNGAFVSGFTGFKNRVINGGMVIDQWNNGASTGASNNFAIDRWYSRASSVGKYNAQRNAGGVTPPAGFTNYLGATSLTAWSITSSDFAAFDHRVEGYNFADMAWGTASAATVTLSFRVYSSLTGTFGGALGNDAFNRSYPFTYSIPIANTWTTISVTIPGDTTGTWGTTNNIGVRIWFNLGTGSTYLGTANTWSAAGLIAPTGTVNVLATNGATFYITGVQLERGSNATSFEFRDYGRELLMCQRYYARMSASLAGTYAAFGTGVALSSTNANLYFKYPVTMRATPTYTISNCGLQYGSGTISAASAGTFYGGTDSALATIAVASGLTAGGAAVLIGNNSASAYIDFAAEL